MIYRSEDRKLAEKEFIRMGFDKDARWRISDVNKDFELCNTYPRFLIVPAGFVDEDLESVAKFRYFRRIPTAVWRHIKNGCFIVRSSQPTVGWFGWFRSELDESLVQSYVSNTLPAVSERINANAKNRSEGVVNSCEQHTTIDSDAPDDGSGDEVRKTPQDDESNLLVQQQDVEQKIQSNHNNNLQNTSAALSHGNGKTSTVIANTITKSKNAARSLSKCDQDTKTSPSLMRPRPESSCLINGNGSPSPSESQDIHSQATPDTDSTILPTSSSKMLIIDARSYTAAMANRAKGGGCECSEYYLRCEVQFMNLANIHSIRKSFHAIRSVCETYSEQSNNWVSSLDNSRWLHHISGLLKSASLIVDTIDIEEKSILIHCSDGWDRTPQLVALAEIMLDPFYRTFEGFRVLIQREWLDFGHKFADRCGSNPCNDDPNERCPVFLQWLDCVQQLLVQYPKHFEFNSVYLDKLNRHTYSNVFGTFSHNSTQERILSRVDERVLSLWSYIDSSQRRFRNEKYVESDEILRPSSKVRDLHFWKEVYLPPLGNQRAYTPIANNIDNKKFYDSLYMDSLTRTVCK